MNRKIAEYISRKFILAVLGMGSGFYLVITGKGGDLGAYTGLVATVLGFYNGANVAQDWLSVRAGKQPTGDK